MLTEFRRRIHPGFMRLKSSYRIGFNSMVGVVGGLLLVAFGITRTALLAKNLPLDAFGLIIILINFSQMGSAIIHFRIQEVFYNFFPNHDEVPQRVPAFLRYMNKLSALSGGLFFSITFPLAYLVLIIFHSDIDLGWPLLIICGIEFFAGYHALFTASLRNANRFLIVILAQVLGGAGSIGLLLALMLSFGTFDLITVAGTLAFGRGIEICVCWITARRFQSERWSGAGEIQSQEPLPAMEKKNIRRYLWNLKIGNVLKLTSDRGGLLILGMLAGSKEAALFGFAQQILRPVGLVQDSFSAVLSPELTRLFRSGQISKLKLVLQRYVLYTLVVLIGFSLLFVPFLDRMIILVGTTEFLSAGSTILILLVAQGFILLSLPFNVLSICMNRIGQRNLVVALRIPCILAVIAIGINHLNLAVAHLIGVLLVRILHDVFLAIQLKETSRKERITT